MHLLTNRAMVPAKSPSTALLPGPDRPGSGLELHKSLKQIIERSKAERPKKKRNASTLNSVDVMLDKSQ